MDTDRITPQQQELIDRVKRIIKWLVTRCRIAASDQDDAEQKVMYELVRRGFWRDEARAQNERLVNIVIRHAIVDFFTYGTAAIRNRRCEAGSFDGWKTDAEGNWLPHADTIPEEAVDWRLGQHRMPRDERRDLSIDVNDRISKLPEKLRLIAIYLKELGSARAVAKVLGRHHSTICDAIEQIRDYFGGLEIYSIRPH